MSDKDTIGFIGLGVMGKPMAGHLLAKGLSASSSTAAAAGPVDALVAAGRRARGRRPRTWRRRPRRIITMLPDSPDVEQVLDGPDGVFSRLQPGTILIDTSSIAPAAARGPGGEGRRRSARRCSTRR